MGWYEFLPRLLNMSMTGTIIILAVIVVRLLLKKAPKAFSYALWGVVLFRLLCPVSFSAEFSLLRFLDVPMAENGTVEYIPVDIVHAEYPQVSLPELTLGGEETKADAVEGDNPSATTGDGAEAGTLAGDKVVSDDVKGAVSYVGQESMSGASASLVERLESTINEQLPKGSEQLGADPLELPITLGTYIWGAGALALLIYNMIQLYGLRKKLRVAEPLRDNIYLADYIDTPFVMGLVRPRIYLPSALSERERSYIVLHEQYHIRRWDHIVKVLAFVALCIHWFNPLVWIAFWLATKDMEMSCDEAVMKQMEEDIRAEYAGSLLQLATGKRRLAGVTLAFGEGDTKSRVQNVMHYKKPAFWVIVIAVIVCAVAVICLIANPKKDLPTPFGKMYEGEELPHAAAWQYRTQLKNNRVFYQLTEDYHLLAKGQVHVDETFREWTDLGQFEEVKLTANNFDHYFYDYSGGYKDQYIDTFLSAAESRRENYKAWKLISEKDGWDLNYYLLQQEDGQLGLACWQADKANEGDAIIKWIVTLESKELSEWEVSSDTIYRSEKCLYMNPASSYMAINGDSGYFYRFTEESFDTIVKYPREDSNIDEVRYPISGLVWKEFPYTEEEWKELFLGGGTLGAVPIPYETKKYLPLTNSCFLVEMDGELWLVEMNTSSMTQDYVWSIYSLVETSEQEVAATPVPVIETDIPIVGVTYRSSEYICTSRYAANWLLDGDSGYLYRIEEDALVMVNKADGSENRLPVEKWAWQELPYTDEEWNLVAENTSYLKDIRSRFKEVKYQPVGEDHFLLKLNDMLLFAEYIDFRLEEHGAYMGDAYTLVPEGWNIETDMKVKGYEEDYMESPDAAYPAEEWRGSDGRVDYPAEALVLDPESTLSERFARFYIPSEVLYEAETVDLLRMSAKWPMTSYDYNYMCYYLDFLTGKFNGADELIDRPDLAETVLKEYQSDTFLPKAELGDLKDQKIYNEKCYAQVDKIVLEEVLLASNRAFDQMDEEMKQATLEEALKKVEQRQSGRFSCHDSASASLAEFPSGFFAYILEQKEAGGSKWYQYLVETGEEELVQKLDGLHVRACWP